MEAGEAELLKAARSGDEDAFGRLIRPCLDRAYRLALRILQNEGEAEDAVQDALLKAWRGLPKFRGGAKFSTWIYRIVWTTCADRRRREQELPLRIDLMDTSMASDPERRWQRQELTGEVEALLGQLSRRYRTVLTLFYMEQMTIKEIAAILDVPVGTVKTHLHRARNALRKLLAADGARWEGAAGEIV